jgi:hypothetical protein
MPRLTTWLFLVLYARSFLREELCYQLSARRNLLTLLIFYPNIHLCELQNGDSFCTPEYVYGFLIEESVYIEI